MSPLDMVVGDPAFWSTPQQVLYMPARRRRTWNWHLCAPNAVPSTVPLADREMLNVTDHGAIVDEVEAAYRHYVEVFNRRDATEVAKLYDRPHAQVSGEIGLSIVNDDADQQQWYEFVMAYLDDQGWGAPRSTRCGSGRCRSPWLNSSRALLATGATVPS